MDAITRRKMTEKEKKVIDDIEEKAKKRKHKREYDINFICGHIEEGSFFKGWDYDCKQDAIDMMNAVVEMLLKVGYFKQKDADEHIKYITEDYIDNWYPEDEDDE